jgi:hypothetical protein
MWYVCWFHTGRVDTQLSSTSPQTSRPASSGPEPLSLLVGNTISALKSPSTSTITGYSVRVREPFLSRNSTSASVMLPSQAGPGGFSRQAGSTPG